MDPDMMEAMMPPPPGAGAAMMPPPPGAGMPMGPPPPGSVTGPMSTMNDPDLHAAAMEQGGDSIMALMEFVDDPEVRRLLEEQDIQRKMLAAQLQAENLMAAEAIMQRMRMNGDSIDMPGGQF